MPAYNYKTVQSYVLFEAQRQLARAADPREQNVQAIPLILGGVGVGKTSLVRYVADLLSLPLGSVNCGETGDTTDLTGVPMPTEVQRDKAGRAFVPWTMSADIYRAVVEPRVLFFDDVDKIPPLAEGALIGLFGKREVKGHKLHPGTILIAAGNRATDDRLARDLSESLRTRATVIELEYTLADLRRYAEDNPGRVDPFVLGYLAYAPHHLHAPDPDAPRFPTPRGWVEFSDEVRAMREGLQAKGALFEELAKNTKAWQHFLLIHKCGEGVAKDYWAWFSILRLIDLKKLLTEGELLMASDLTKEQREMLAANARLQDFAAVSAIAATWNNKGIDPAHTGVLPYLQNLAPELRVALYTQLTQKSRKLIATRRAFAEVGNMLIQDIARAEGA